LVCDAARFASAIQDGVLPQSERFSLHGLKHRGMSDTIGNIADVQDAAGHKSPTMAIRYHHNLRVVKPPERQQS
jgi:hypothetical protein